MIGFFDAEHFTGAETGAVAAAGKGDDDCGC